MIRFLAVFLILFFGFPVCYACSAIVLKQNGQIFLAKNFDWTIGNGMILQNQRGAEKSAYYTHSGNPARWVSQFGSITFNQNGKDMPYGGMNEKGLVVEMLWLDYSQYNLQEDKPYVNELEWIQYQLDNFENLSQVLAHLNELKVYPIKGSIHYILSDAAGESIIVEYLNGQAKVHKKEAHHCQAITNNSVSFSENYKTETRGISANNTNSLYRYYLLEQKIASLNELTKLEEGTAFDLLKKVAITKGDFKTMWSIVYNIHNKSLSFFTNTHKKIKTLSLTEMDFSQATRYIDMNQDKQIEPGSSLLPLSEAVNFTYLKASLQHLGFDELVIKEMSLHPFQGNAGTNHIFMNNYFHLELTIGLDEDQQTCIVAVLDSEENFARQQPVTGGFLYGKVGKGQLTLHVYGLKNGRYAILAAIDKNKNRKLDFQSKGKPIEPYAIGGDKVLAKEKDLNFEHTSQHLTRANAQVSLQWIY